MKQVILTTVADDSDGAGFALMRDLFERLCFSYGIHGEVVDGGTRCVVDCGEQSAFNEAMDLQVQEGNRYDINKLLIREVEI